MSTIVTILTDYGRTDEFAGVLRLAIERVAPGTPCVELTHDIPAYDVRAGALTLWRNVPWLAPGVALAVVDPGVGTARRPVAIEVATAAGPLHLVGPDNGLLLPAALAAGGPARAVELRDPTWHLPPPAAGPGLPRQRGATFDGRDVFAPVAAHLAAGVPLDRLGPEIPVASLAGDAVPEPVADAASGGIVCTVLWVDRFGNVQLNATPRDLPRGAVPAGAAHLDGPAGAGLAVRLPDGRTLPVRTVPAFADLGRRPGSPAGSEGWGAGGRLRPGSPAGSEGWGAGGRLGAGAAPAGLVTDSYGLIALCLDQASAAATFGLSPGQELAIHPAGPFSP